MVLIIMSLKSPGIYQSRCNDKDSNSSWRKKIAFTRR